MTKTVDDLLNDMNTYAANKKAAAEAASNTTTTNQSGSLESVLGGIGDSIKNVGTSIYGMIGTGWNTLLDLFDNDANKAKTYDVNKLKQTINDLQNRDNLTDSDIEALTTFQSMVNAAGDNDTIQGVFLDDGSFQATVEGKNTTQFKKDLYGTDSEGRVNYGKAAGQALDAAATLSNFIPGANGVVGNTIQGVVSGIGNAYAQGGNQTELGDALKAGLAGGAAGLTTSGLNLGINKALSKGGNLINNRVINNSLTRGAISGATGGATAAGVGTLLNGGTLEDAGRAAASGAGAGLVQGGISGLTMAGANKVIGKTKILGGIQNGLNQLENDYQTAKANGQGYYFGNNNLIKERIQNGTEPNFTDFESYSTDVERGAPARMLESSSGAKMGSNSRGISEIQSALHTTMAQEGSGIHSQMSPDSGPSVVVDSLGLEKNYDQYLARQKAGQALLDQYGTVDTPTARATRPVETVLEVADAGFTKPSDVVSAINKITGSDGKVNKLTKKVVANAGNINTMDDFNGETFDDYVKGLTAQEGLGEVGNSTEADKIYKQIENMTGSLPSRRNGTLTGLDPAEDVFDVVQRLERKAAEYEGKGGTYHRPTSEDVYKATVLKSVATQLKDRIFDASDISKVVTQDVIDETKSWFPNNEKWAAKVDSELATARTGQDLRSFQAPFVKMSKIIDNTITTSGTVGSKLGKAVKTAVTSNPLGLIVNGAEMLADTQKGKEIISQAKYKYYNNKANNNAAASTTSTGSSPSGGAPSANGPTSTGSSQNKFVEWLSTPSPINTNLIGQKQGATTGAATIEGLLASQAQNDNVDSAITGTTGVSHLSSANSDTSGSTISSELNRLGRAMEMALNAGDFASYEELANIYQTVGGLSSDSSTTQTKLTSTQQRANAAMNSLERIAQMEPDTGYTLSGIPIIGDIATFGGNNYEAEAKSLAQQIGYMVSGANIKDSEAEAIGKAYVPQPFDSEATRQQKLQRAYEIILQYQNGYAGE